MSINPTPRVEGRPGQERRSGHGGGNRIYPSYAARLDVQHRPVPELHGRRAVYGVPRRSKAGEHRSPCPSRRAEIFNRCGKATWIGMIKDPHGRPVGPFVTQANRWVA